LAASSQFSLTGSFTVDCWFYLTSNPPNDNNGLPTAALAIYWSTSLTGGQGFEFNVTTGASGSITFTKAGSATGISANYTSFVLNSWYHVAITYNGTTGALYLNGTSLTLSANNWAWTIPSGTPILRVGGSVFAAGYNHYFPGYISNFRIVNGSAIAPPAGGPTSPVTAVSGTSLLANYANGGIYDAASQNNAITVADAGVATLTSLFNATPMYFDGTGDYLTSPLNPGTTITSGDFTVEFWLYPSTVATAYQAIIGTREGDTGATINWSVLLQANQLRTDIYTSAGVLMAGFLHQTTLSANAWYYCAVVRSGSTFTLYVNGVAGTTTATSSATIGQSGTTLWVGRFGASSSASALNGYLQDVRITKGVARTITLPTTSFPTR
jgi:hypothetical protein